MFVNPLNEENPNINVSTRVVLNSIFHGSNLLPFCRKPHSEHLANFRKCQFTSFANKNRPHPYMEKDTQTNMAWREKLDVVLQTHKFDVTLKAEQEEIISAVLAGKDVFAQLPTGYGKSLIYTLIPLLMDELNWDRKHTILVISPLRALMRDQVQTLKDHNITATAFSEDFTLQDFEGSSVVFSSPEAAILPKWKRLIRKTSISVVVFDEAHCISQWGLDFRPDYRKVSILQSYLAAPTLVLTATATSEIQRDIYEVLGMTEESTEVIAALPDRPNIFLQMDEVTENFHVELSWLPGHLKQENSEGVKKIILYVRSINTCQQIFNWVLDEMGDGIFSTSEKTPETRTVEMYHAHTDDLSKNRILEQFTTPSGNLKLLISTVAFGMGINIPDVDLVVHWGIPPSALSYWQEIGRCARDGRGGYAICYSFKRSVTKCKDESLKRMVDKDAEKCCLRQVILKTFVLKGMTESNLTTMDRELYNHDHCEGTCKCHQCKCCTLCLSKCKCKLKCSNSLEQFLKS